MGQSSSRHQQQSQDFSKNPQPPARASRGGARNSGNDGPSKDVDNSQTVPSSFEPSALQGAVLKEDGKYFVESEANMAALKGRVTALESAVSDWNSLLNGFMFCCWIYIGYTSAEIVSTLAYRYIKPRGFKPSLVRETTRLLARDVVFHPIKTLQKLKTSDAQNNVVLPPIVEKQLEKITSDAKAKRKDNGPYPRVLMHGPRGTGKTMAAKKLAQDLGMVYASTTGYTLSRESDGSDPSDEHGVPAINQFFKWASTSKEGVLLFIDNADFFLKKRSREDTSRELEDMHKAFLGQIGDHCKKVMVVLATEAVEQPVWLREYYLGETVKFELPGVEERKRIIELYVKKRVPGIAARIKKSYDAKVLDDEGLYSEMANMTEGFCGSELKDLASRVARLAFEDGDFREMAVEHCQQTVKEHEKWARIISEYEVRSKKRADDQKDSATLAPEVPSNGAGEKTEGILTA